MSYGNQPCFPHSYIHKNAKESGILHFAGKDCPNLQIFQADYASLEIGFIKIYKERGRGERTFSVNNNTLYFQDTT